MRLEGKDPEQPKDVRTVAVKLTRHFGLDQASPSEAIQGLRPKEIKPPVPKPASAKVLVNPPLDFELQGLDPEHPYFAEHGIGPSTVDRFGLGYCARGMLKFRIAIPIHDEEGQLIGYAGRLTKDTDISEVNPKYRFPGPRDRGATTLEFRKSHLLYNLHRVQRPAISLIVVEGFRSVWHLDQCGHSNVVALMGASCSPDQASQILKAVQEGGRILFLTDGDAAGTACATSLFYHLAPYRWCKWIKLAEGEQPVLIPENVPLSFCRLTALERASDEEAIQ